MIRHMLTKVIRRKARDFGFLGSVSGSRVPTNLTLPTELFPCLQFQRKQRKLNAMSQNLYAKSFFSLDSFCPSGFGKISTLTANVSNPKWRIDSRRGILDLQAERGSVICSNYVPPICQRRVIVYRKS